MVSTKLFSNQMVDAMVKLQKYIELYVLLIYIHNELDTLDSYLLSQNSVNDRAICYYLQHSLSYYSYYTLCFVVIYWIEHLNVCWQLASINKWKNCVFFNKQIQRNSYLNLLNSQRNDLFTCYAFNSKATKEIKNKTKIGYIPFLFVIFSK